MELPFEWGAAGALLSVIIIDVVMAGDNAVVVGMAAATLPEHLRRRVIFLGIVTATLMRIALASVAGQILDIIGLTLAGGVLLLWVAWKFYRELREAQARKGRPRAIRHPPRTWPRRCCASRFADLSMSLDNVLAVAGTARVAFLGAGDRAALVGGADGLGLAAGGAAHAPLPLDRLARPRHRHLRGLAR